MEGSQSRSGYKWRVHVVSFCLCCVTVELDSFAGTSHSEQVTHVIRYLKRAEQRYTRIVATRSWAPDEA